MTFPSLHTRTYRRGGQPCSLYEIGRALSDQQMKQLIASLQQKGLPVESLEFYEYGPSDTLRHLFVRLKGNPNPIPYFQLTLADWQLIVEELRAYAD